MSVTYCPRARTEFDTLLVFDEKKGWVAAARRSGLGVSLLARVYPPEGRWTDRA